MKEIHEAFAKFFEEPTRVGLRELLRYNFGEQDDLDFKKQWPPLENIAKHIIAFANSGGGCIVLGVEETKDGLEAVGLDSTLDKADITKGVSRYLPAEIDYSVQNFSYSDSEYSKIVGKVFQVIFIEYKPEYIPFVTKGESNSLKKATIYVRNGTSSVPATYEDIQRLVSKRIETGYSSTAELDLEQHLAQLKILYGNISRYKYSGGIGAVNQGIVAKMFQGVETPNSNFPEEDYENFILRMITKKKVKIENELSLI
ncbi:ATP-binding protein [Acetobacterium wieringae]|uniref:AlbA family DNA-binding domain-containing protein n=1 Tax=Acetobacterium wieringae TaxID=52694 RepID=UPI003158192C